MGPDDIIADELLGHQLDLLRLDAGTANRVLALLRQLQDELTAKLATGTLTELNKARVQAMLKQANDAIDRYYGRIQQVSEATLRGVGEAQGQHITDTLNRVLAGMEATLPTETFLARLVSNVLVQGAPSSAWWSRQSKDLQFRFANVVRQGITQGQTNEEIVRRVAGTRTSPGIMDIARNNARALVHTSIQAVANEARMETFQRNADIVESLVWLATLDPHTCVRCMARDLHLYALDDDRTPLDGGPPWLDGPGALHWGDRCIASIKTKLLPGEPERPVGQRASADGPVRGSTSFEEFLRRKGEAWQDEVLGAGRAALWRKKKLTLEQLLDLRGNPLTIEQLMAKYGS